MGFCVPIRDTWDRAHDRLYHFFPCLADPTRRSSCALKVALFFIHFVIVGALFVFGDFLIQKARIQPWYTAVYLLLFVASLAQYFFTSGSSPGYVQDAMRTVNETHAIVTDTPVSSKHSASGRNGSFTISVEGSQPGRNSLGANITPWTKFVMDLYRPGTPIRSCTCTYCSIMQPPRSRHCPDCDKCVLEFDHHCLWLGTCIGQGNHCRFWWYIFLETALSIWTGILYITYLKANFARAWWQDAIMILLFSTLTICLIFLLLLLFFHSYLVLTNQTTYELVRRRRIPYLRDFPERVYPFSKGICRNLYNFCCVRTSVNSIERLPLTQELELKANPYTCCDVLSCRCC